MWLKIQKQSTWQNIWWLSYRSNPLSKPWQQLRGVVLIISYYYVHIGMKKWKQEAVGHWSFEMHQCCRLLGLRLWPQWEAASLCTAEFGWDNDLVCASFGIFLEPPLFNSTIELSDLGFHPCGELGCLGMRSRYGDTPYFQPTPPNQNPG